MYLLRDEKSHGVVIICTAIMPRSTANLAIGLGGRSPWRSPINIAPEQISPTGSGVSIDPNYSTNKRLALRNLAADTSHGSSSSSILCYACEDW